MSITSHLIMECSCSLLHSNSAAILGPRYQAPHPIARVELLTELRQYSSRSSTIALCWFDLGIQAIIRGVRSYRTDVALVTTDYRIITATQHSYI